MPELPFAYLGSRHAGRTVWVVGAGPSLDVALAQRLVRAPCIGINRAIDLPLPRPLYYIGVDPHTWRSWPGGQPPGVIALADGQMLSGQDPEQAPHDPRNHPNPYVVYTRHYDRPITDRAEAVRRATLFDYWGSATDACYLAWVMGASEVVLVGCDGGTGQASAATPPHESVEPEQMWRARNFDRMRNSAIRCCNLIGMPWRDAVPREEMPCPDTATSRP